MRKKKGLTERWYSDHEREEAMFSRSRDTRRANGCKIIKKRGGKKSEGEKSVVVGDEENTLIT
ncbi:hypothetical protein [Bartonella queenslandensis]|uniref:hypothetical protein n=1 Tax=Bartonella queenslandensis TaxID=481138 RepID=UPI0002E81FC2|nr:hypothetical protein [Bartonella queenslandensis]